MRFVARKLFYFVRCSKRSLDQVYDITYATADIDGFGASSTTHNRVVERDTFTFNPFLTITVLLINL